MPNVMFNKGKAEMSPGGSVNWAADTIRVVLVTGGYAPDKDAHDFADDVTNEFAGAGYAAGGQALANRTKTPDDAVARVAFCADDVSWAGATVTARGAVVYKDTGNPATSPLICYVDFGADVTSTNGTYTIPWAAAGVLHLGE